MTIRRLNPGSRMSDAVVHNGTVYLSGQVASDDTLPVAGQTRQVLDKVDALLAEAGTDKMRLVSASIWLKDISRFDEMNAVWDAWVSPGHAPARATVGAALARDSLLVEISVIAALP